MMDMLADVRDLVTRCNRCGFCQDVCPTYGVSRDEFQVARGRIRTLRQVIDGKFDSVLGQGIPVQVDQCLLCGACAANCPSGVPTDIILQKVRAGLLARKGFSLFHSLVYRGILTRGDRLEKITGLVRLLDRTPLRNQVARNAAAAALPMVRQAVTAMPRGLGRPARARMGQRVQSAAARGGICYFMGCGTNAFTPEVGLAVVRMLTSLGFRVSVPDLPCCGGPHFSAGDMARARRLARENIETIYAMAPEVIVTDCATCAHTLHQYPELFDSGDPVREKAERLCEKMVDLHAFLAHHIYSGRNVNAADDPEKKRLSPSGTVRVTYHDPCHGVRGMKVAESPRDLLNAVPGLELVEMAGTDTCCGGAGSYAFRHPEMSQRILDRKVDAIAETRADVVATSCPSCALQIMAGLWRRGLSHINVTHPVVLAAGCVAGIPKQTRSDNG